MIREFETLEDVVKAVTERGVAKLSREVTERGSLEGDFYRLFPEPSLDPIEIQLRLEISKQGMSYFLEHGPRQEDAVFRFCQKHGFTFDVRPGCIIFRQRDPI